MVETALQVVGGEINKDQDPPAVLETLYRLVNSDAGSVFTTI